MASLVGVCWKAVVENEVRTLFPESCMMIG